MLIADMNSSLLHQSSNIDVILRDAWLVYQDTFFTLFQTLYLIEEIFSDSPCVGSCWLIAAVLHMLLFKAFSILKTGVVLHIIRPRRCVTDHTFHIARQILEAVQLHTK